MLCLYIKASSRHSWNKITYVEIRYVQLAEIPVQDWVLYGKLAKGRTKSFCTADKTCAYNNFVRLGRKKSSVLYERQFPYSTPYTVSIGLNVISRISRGDGKISDFCRFIAFLVVFCIYTSTITRLYNHRCIILDILQETPLNLYQTGISSIFWGGYFCTVPGKTGYGLHFVYLGRIFWHEYNFLFRAYSTNHLVLCRKYNLYSTAYVRLHVLGTSMQVGITCQKLDMQTVYPVH